MDVNDFFDRPTPVMPENYEASINEEWDEITPIWTSNFNEIRPLTKKTIDIHSEQTNNPIEEIKFECDISNIEIDSDHIFDLIWCQPDKNDEINTNKQKNKMSLKEKLYAYLWEGVDIRKLI